MNTVIQDNGNSCFKITVTNNQEVRIKLQKDTPVNERDEVVQKLKDIASSVINENQNTGTLRGKCKATDKSISLYTDSKKFVCKHSLES